MIAQVMGWAQGQMSQAICGFRSIQAVPSAQPNQLRLPLLGIPRSIRRQLSASIRQRRKTFGSFSGEK
jgi:hypothetical protein